jgi:DNA polymerase I-like protein with 3'-5' exonuclease and polymerase domains
LKVLFLQEYIREDHMKNDNGTLKNVFLQTKGGGILRQLAESQEGLGLKRSDYYIDYAYALVPKVLQRNKYNRAIKYKVPSQKEAKPEAEYLYERIVREKPDIVIPTGNLGCKALLNSSSIKSVRGVPQKVTVKSTGGNPEPSTELDEEKLYDLEGKLARAVEEKEYFLSAYRDKLHTSEALKNESVRLEKQITKYDNEIESLKSRMFSSESTHTCWVLPTYSMEFMLVNPNIQNLIEADFVTLSKYINEGDSAFEAGPVDYEHVTDIERVREIFNKEIPNAPISAWDLETNTLKPEMPGAKPLVISISWKEGEGVTIPLEHNEHQWLPGHLAEIYKLTESYVADENLVKVGHNIQYDMRFLRLTRNFTVFKNHRDTKQMYYALVNQEVKSSLRLSDLAYEMTDMGGYDRPLEDFKKQYQKDWLAKEKARIAALKEQYKAEVAAEKKLAKEEGRKAVVPPKPDFPSATQRKNEIDGSNFNYEWIPLKTFLSPYAAGDVDACLRIHNKLDAIGLKPENKRIRELYTGHFVKLTDSLAHIEANGVKMDTAYVEGLITAYTEEEERLLQEMRKFPQVQQLEAEMLALYRKGVVEFADKAPKDRDPDLVKLRNKYKKEEDRLFSPNSSDHKKKVLFEYTDIKLPYNKEYLVDSANEDGIPEDEIEWYHYKTDTKVVLPYLSKNHPEVKELADLLITHSLVKTRKQNFTYKLLEMVDPEHKLHGGFNSTGTATSRLSSSSPNLQQMPRKTGDVTRFDYKHPIKRMFVTSFEGGAILQLDYSSLESRILALAANDEEMTQAFLDGADIHSETASLVFNVPIEEVSGDMRSSAKSTTFGIAYGETPFSYYSKHGMTLEEAEKLFEDFFRNKPKIKQFIDETHEFVKKTGYVECLQGFRRNLRDIFSQDNSKKNGALRQSVNTRIQGTGAYLTNESVIYINQFIRKHNLRSKIIMTVHDSIVIDAPKEEIHIIARAAKYIMENLPVDWLFIDWKGDKLRYPIAADVEIGVNYNDMVDYDVDDINSFQTIENYCNFMLGKKKLKDYMETKLITKERHDEMLEQYMANKPRYQAAM